MLKIMQESKKKKKKRQKQIHMAFLKSAAAFPALEETLLCCLFPTTSNHQRSLWIGRQAVFFCALSKWNGDTHTEYAVLYGTTQRSQIPTHVQLQGRGKVRCIDIQVC